MSASDKRRAFAVQRDRLLAALGNGPAMPAELQRTIGESWVDAAIKRARSAGDIAVDPDGALSLSISVRESTAVRRREAARSQRTARSLAPLTVDLGKRDPKIAKRIRRGETAEAVGERYDITPRHADRIASTILGPRRQGRKPTNAVTHQTPRGRAALTQLVADAAAAGLEVEVYLGMARTRSCSVAAASSVTTKPSPTCDLAPDISPEGQHASALAIATAIAHAPHPDIEEAAIPLRANHDDPAAAAALDAALARHGLAEYELADGTLVCRADLIDPLPVITDPSRRPPCALCGGPA